MALVSKIVQAAEFASKGKARTVEAFTRAGGGYDIVVRLKDGRNWAMRSDTPLEFDWVADPEIQARQYRIYQEGR